jgi:hypothetical protein
VDRGDGVLPVDGGMRRSEDTRSNAAARPARRSSPFRAATTS